MQPPRGRPNPILSLRREDADGVPASIEHVIPAPVRTHLHGDAHAITLRVADHSNYLLKLAAGRKSLDARGRTGLGGKNVAIWQHPHVLRLAPPTEISC